MHTRLARRIPTREPLRAAELAWVLEKLGASAFGAEAKDGASVNWCLAICESMPVDSRV